MKLKISRKHWLRGNDPRGVLFDSTSRKMCCLGFYGRAQGLRIGDIINLETPAFVVQDASDKKTAEKAEKAFSKLLTPEGQDTELCTQLVSVNDNAHLTEDERESKIHELFSKIGVDVMFVD